MRIKDRLKALWARFGDWNDLQSLFELFGWRDWLSATAGAVLMLAVAKVASNWSWSLALLAAFAAFCFINVGLLAHKKRKTSVVGKVETVTARSPPVPTTPLVAPRPSDVIAARPRRERVQIERILGGQPPPLGLAFSNHPVGSLTRAEVLFGFGSGSAGVFVPWFRIKGRSQHNEPIVLYDAYVVPQLTRERLRLDFEIADNERVDIHDTYGIPPNAEFVLSTWVPGRPANTDQACITSAEFLEQIGGFQIVVQANGFATVVCDVAYADVESMMRAAERAHAQPAPPPRVRRRE